MASKSRRKKINHHTCRSVTIPKEMDRGTGDYATLAYGRFILMDPRAEVSEEILLELLEEEVEPAYYRKSEGEKNEG